MEFWRFIFSSFWIWLGFITLVAVVLKYLVDIIKALRNARNVHTYKTKDGWQVLVTNASHDDVEVAMVRQELREHLDELKSKEVVENG